MTILKQEKIFCVCVKELIRKVLCQDYEDFIDHHKIHFVITCSKIEFNLLQSTPSSDIEMHKITSILNGLFKVTSLQLKGWNENFIYKLNIVPACSQFMTIFKIINDIHFDIDEIVAQSKIFT